jgi:hypothetical protein
MTFYRTKSGFGEYLASGSSPEGEIACDLPRVFCRPGVMRDAQTEGMSLLQYWRDMGTGGLVGAQVKGLLDKAESYLPTISSWSSEKASKLVRDGLEHLEVIRAKLDALKPFINQPGIDGKPIITAAEWSEQNREWYVWVAAVAQGISPTDKLSGRVVAPPGIEQAFGDRFPISGDLTANYYDGLHFGRMAANEEAGTDALDLVTVEVSSGFGAVQIPLGVVVVAGAVVVALFYWLSQKELTARERLLNERLARLPKKDLAKVLRANPGAARTKGGMDLPVPGLEIDLTKLILTVAGVGAAVYFGPQLIAAGKSAVSKAKSRRRAVPA